MKEINDDTKVKRNNIVKISVLVTLSILVAMTIYALLHGRHTGIYFPWAGGFITLPLRHWVVFGVTALLSTAMLYFLLFKNNLLKRHFLLFKSNLLKRHFEKPFEWWEWGLLLVLCIKFAILIFWHFGASVNSIHGDESQGLLNTARLFQYYGTPFPSGFRGFSLTPVVQYILALLITNDYFLYIALALVRWFLFAIMIVVFSIYMFKNRSFLLYGCILLAALSVQYVHLPGAVQYHTMARALLLFLFMASSVDESFRITGRIKFAIACFLLVQMAFSGLLRFGLIVIPLIVSIIFVYLVDNRTKMVNEITDSLKRGAIWLCIVLAASAAGFFLAYFVTRVDPVALVVDDWYFHRNPTMHGNAGQISTSLQHAVTSFLHIFGATGGMRMLSLDGFRTMMLIVVAIAFILIFPICLTRKYTKETLNVKRFTVFSWTLLAIHVVVVLFTNNMPGPIPRYLIPPTIPLVMMSGYYIYKYLLKPRAVTRYVWLIVLVVYAVIQIPAQFEFANTSRFSQVERFAQVEHELRAREARIGFASFNNAGLATMLFDYDIVVASVATLPYQFNRSQLSVYPFGYPAYFHLDTYVGPSFLLLTPEEFGVFMQNDALWSILGPPIEIFSSSRFIVVVYDYNIYTTFVGQLVLAGDDVPQVVAVPDLSVSSFHTNVGVQSDEVIISTGDAGALMFGPYLPLPSGRFELSVDMDMVLMTERSTHEALGWGDFAFNQGADVIERREIHVDDFEEGRFTLSLEVELDEAVSDFEFRVFVNDGVILRLSNPRIIDLLAE